MEYSEDKVNELAARNKDEKLRDLHRGTNECKKGYQPVTNLVTEVNGDLLADSHNILNRWKN
jgi:hypothetical protein